MSILVSQRILDCIRDELSKSTESFLLISAYCKLPLVKYFDSCISDSSIEKKLVVRFRPDDIASGASDLEIYPYCRDNGWKLYFRLDLHAKTYVFDHLRCIVGSANATSSGLSIGGTGNYEMAATCELSDADLRTLKLLLLGAIEMNDAIYDSMQTTMANHSVNNGVSLKWPQEIINMFQTDCSLLFAEDFPSCAHPKDAGGDELLFLNLLPGASITEIAEAFCQSKCYQWIRNLVKNSDSKELFFGSITASLHYSLLNDPKPYRKDVKQLLSNLLGWISALPVEEIQVDRPSHSQRIRYIDREA